MFVHRVFADSLLAYLVCSDYFPVMFILNTQAVGAVWAVVSLQLWQPLLSWV